MSLVLCHMAAATVLAAELPLPNGGVVLLFGCAGSRDPRIAESVGRAVEETLSSVPHNAHIALALPSPTSVSGSTRTALQRGDPAQRVVVTDLHADSPVRFVPIFASLGAMLLGSSLSKAAGGLPEQPSAPTVSDAATAHAVVGARAAVDARGGGAWDLVAMERPPDMALARLPPGLSFAALAAFLIAGWTPRLPPSPSGSSPLALLPPPELFWHVAMGDWRAVGACLRGRLALGVERLREESRRLRALERSGEPSGYFGGLPAHSLEAYADASERLHGSLYRAIEDGRASAALRAEVLSNDAALDVWAAEHAGALGGPLAVLGREKPATNGARRRTVLELVYGCGALGQWVARCDAALSWVDDGEDAAFAADALAAGWPRAFDSPAAVKAGVAAAVARGASLRYRHELRFPARGAMPLPGGGAAGRNASNAPQATVAIVPLAWMPTILASWPHGGASAPPPLPSGWLAPPPPQQRAQLQETSSNGSERSFKFAVVAAPPTHPLCTPIYSNVDAMIANLAPVIAATTLFRNRARLPAGLRRGMRLAANAALAVGGGLAWMTLSLNQRLDEALGGD